MSDRHVIVVGGGLAGLTAACDLGTVTGAEDAVQEAFLRLQRTGVADIDNVGGWLNRTTSRICLDRLTAAQARREVYVGTWLPEPLETDADPTDPVELAESISMAFLVVLESLSPAERVAFVLHEVFGHSHAEVAAVLDRSEQASRQLVEVAPRRPLGTESPQVWALSVPAFHGAERGRTHTLVREDVAPWAPQWMMPTPVMARASCLLSQACTIWSM